MKLGREKKIIEFAPLLIFICTLITACAPAEVHLEPAGHSPAGIELPEAGISTEVPVDPDTPLEIDVEDAILMSLMNNHALAVTAIDRNIRKTFEKEEDAAFDPLLSADVSAGRNRSRTVGAADSTRTEQYSGSAGIEKSFPTGTDVGVEASTTRGESTRADDPLHESRIGLTVTQSILRGFGTDVNLANVRQARLNTLRSEYELQGFTESLVAQVEKTCWNYWLALRQIEIFEESVRLARQQLDETRQRIEVGALAETELAASQAEVALREEALINARSSLAATRLALLRLLNPNGSINWHSQLVLNMQPEPPENELEDVEVHAAISISRRPELNQAKLDIERNELELVKTRNGLLPRLDLFITLGRTGYSRSFLDSMAGEDGSGYDVLAGARFEFPAGNRAASARHERAQWTLEESRLALANLEQLIQVELRTAYLEVNRTREQIAATAATRIHQEEKLRAERRDREIPRGKVHIASGGVSPAGSRCKPHRRGARDCQLSQVIG